MSCLLLDTDAEGLNEAAKNYKTIYPIAARYGVFAKTDIQPLINEGAKKEDLAVSIFQAVVNQTISGLACGRTIEGKVAFLGWLMAIVEVEYDGKGKYALSGDALFREKQRQDRLAALGWRTLRVTKRDLKNPFAVIFASIFLSCFAHMFAISTPGAL